MGLGRHKEEALLGHCLVLCARLKWGGKFLIGMLFVTFTSVENMLLFNSVASVSFALNPLPV